MVVWHSRGQHVGVVLGRHRQERRGQDTVCRPGSWQDSEDRGAGSRCISPPTDAPATPPHSSSVPQTGQDRQRGQAAPRERARGCRVFIHHMTRRHSAGGQDRARHQGRRCPSCDLGMGWRQEAGGQGRGKRGLAPGWALVWGGQGQGLCGGHLHTLREFSPLPFATLSPDPRPHRTYPAPLFTE